MVFIPDDYLVPLINMVFNCRMCAEFPVSSWFGQESGKQEDSVKAKISVPAPKPSSRMIEKFERRTDDEINDIIASWDPYVHPRAREFFSSQNMLTQVLQQLARGIHKTEEPVLGKDDVCCHWYGEVTKELPQQACIRMVKPGESTESMTFVNRVLVFIFATDESFEQLMRLPKEPFRMACGDQLCISLSHISVD